MVEQKYIMVRMKRASIFSPYLSQTEVAGRCGTHPDLIERFVQLGLLDIAERDIDGELLFHRDVVPQVKRILRLRNELGVNYAGIGVILELMARIEAMEARIRELEGNVFGRD